MIATWMVYGLVASALMAAVGLLCERAVQHAGLPLRWSWLVVCAAMVALCMAPLAIGLVRGDGAESNVHTLNFELSAAQQGASHIGERAGRFSFLTWWREQIRLVARAAAASPRMVAWQSGAAAWNGALLVGWALMSSALLVRLAQSGVSSRRERLRDVTSAIEDFDGVPVRRTESLGPAAVGIRHPRILLPRWISELDPGLQALVLRHEWEHASVRDPALLGAATLCLLLLPWNVLLWWAVHRLRLAIELDCDASVLRRVGDVRRYGQLLLHISTRIGQEPWLRSAPAFSRASLQPRQSHLSRRIVAMTRSRSARPIRSVALLFAAVTLAACAYEIPAPRMRAPASETAVKPAGHRTGDVWGTVTLSTKNGKPARVLIYVTDSAALAVSTSISAIAPGSRQMHLFTDTLSIMTPATFDVNLTGGDVQFVSLDGNPLTMSAQLSGAPAMSTSARGVRFRLNRGGTGVSFNP